jgi:hypothetical protein
MMISDFVTLIKRVVSMEMSGIITMIIIALIVGAITHRVVSGLQSAVVLTVANLVMLLIWFEVWRSSTLLVGVVSTVCLVVSGNGLYRRMLMG